jgi:hypothetical protein
MQDERRKLDGFGACSENQQHRLQDSEYVRPRPAVRRHSPVTPGEALIDDPGL